jgi:hypothetical protein
MRDAGRWVICRGEERGASARLSWPRPSTDFRLCVHRHYTCHYDPDVLRIASSCAGSALQRGFLAEILDAGPYGLSNARKRATGHGHLNVVLVKPTDLAEQESYDDLLVSLKPSNLRWVGIGN